MKDFIYKETPVYTREHIYQKVSGKQPSVKGKTAIQRYDFSNVVS